jgi:phospholipid-transporting ATPase
VAEKIEQELFFLGVTAVEDRLQDRVPKTIQAFHMAGIDIWMLTGDKMETAENIAKTCGLISSNMAVRLCKTEETGGVTEADSLKEVYRNLQDIQTFFNSTQDTNALVIDGNSIEIILFDKNNLEKCKQHPELVKEENTLLIENCRAIFIALS